MENENFETKIEKANVLLNELMKNDITLDASLKAYESGLKELNEAQKMLEEATLKVKKLQDKKEED